MSALECFTERGNAPPAAAARTFPAARGFIRRRERTGRAGAACPPLHGPLWTPTTTGILDPADVPARGSGGLTDPMFYAQSLLWVGSENGTATIVVCVLVLFAGENVSVCTFYLGDRATFLSLLYA